MKPFNLELAKQGHPVCTRDGRKARILAFDLNAKDPIVAAITNLKGKEGKEFPLALYEDGKYSVIGESDCDLMMATVKHTYWANVYQIGDENFRTGMFHTTEEYAKKCIDTCPDETYLATVKIEWEE